MIRASAVMSHASARFLAKYLTLLILLLSSGLGAPGIFAQATPTPTAGFFSVAGCTELLSNGGFEVVAMGWSSAVPGLPAEYAERYVTDVVFSGSRAMRLGYLEAPNLELRNGIRQTVLLPASASTIVLGFRYRPVHEANPGNDIQYADIIDPVTDTRITRLWAQLSSQSNWLFLQYDLTSLRGRTVQIEFGVQNDGQGGRTALFLDNVSLLACDGGGATPPSPATATPTPQIILISPTPISPVASATASPSPSTTSTPLASPTSTPQPSPTAVPAGCSVSMALQNGSFEQHLGSQNDWILGNDPVPPEPSGTSQDGLRSLRMGNPPDSGQPNVETYSSARQFVTLPASALTAQLSWSHRSHSEDGFNPSPSRTEDRQEVILLYSDLSTKRILYRRLINNGTWSRESVDLTPFIGQSFYVYFNVYNNGSGGRTWMFLDDVELQICFSPPTPSPTPTYTPTPFPTVTPISDAGNGDDVIGTALQSSGQVGDAVNDVSNRAGDLTEVRATQSEEGNGEEGLLSRLAQDIGIVTAFWIVLGLFLVLNFFRWLTRATRSGRT
jgi:hypothetical protein